MNASIEWENVNLAGAFIIGAVLATIATLRVVRSAVTMLARHLPPLPPTCPPEARTGDDTVVDT